MLYRRGFMLDKAAQAGQHAYEERGADVYETPACAVEALLRVENIPRDTVWEPACGPGAIVKVLQARGYTVAASDKFDYGWNHAVEDFLIGDLAWHGPIVTNPPYQLAADFVRKAISISPYVAMLLRLAFLESAGRADIFDHPSFARVHVFSERLPMMHRSGYHGKKSSSAIAFCWMVWCSDHRGPTTIDRISWKNEVQPALHLR